MAGHATGRSAECGAGGGWGSGGFAANAVSGGNGLQGADDTRQGPSGLLNYRVELKVNGNTVPAEVATVSDILDEAGMDTDDDTHQFDGEAISTWVTRFTTTATEVKVLKELPQGVYADLK